MADDGNFEISETEYEIAPTLSLQDYDDEVVVLNKEQKEVLETAFRNLEFELGSDQISVSSKRALDSLSVELIKNVTWKLKLGGHTDNSGSESKNLLLSLQRANSVKNYLSEQGVPEDRLVVKYFGDKYPIANNSTVEGRQKNRWVEMLLIRE